MSNNIRSHIFALDIKYLQYETFLYNCKKILSKERLEKASRFVFIEDQLRSLAAGLVLDYALSIFGLREQTCSFSYTDGGKMYIPSSPSIQFNISHAGEYAICFICQQNPPCNIGIDIEKVGIDGLEIASHWFQHSETAYLLRQKPQDRPKTFARMWTYKESMGKCIGVGLGLELDSVVLLPATQATIWQGKQYYFNEYHELESYAITACSLQNSFPQRVQILEAIHTLCYSTTKNAQSLLFKSI